MARTGADNSRGRSAKIITIIQVLWATVIMVRITQASMQDSINKVTLDTRTTTASTVVTVGGAAEAVGSMEVKVAAATTTTGPRGTTRTATKCHNNTEITKENSPLTN